MVALDCEHVETVSCRHCWHSKRLFDCWIFMLNILYAKLKAVARAAVIYCRSHDSGRGLLQLKVVNNNTSVWNTSHECYYFFGFCLTSIFFWRQLQISPIGFPRTFRECWWDDWDDLCRPDALCVTQPTASKQDKMKLRNSSTRRLCEQ